MTDALVLNIDWEPVGKMNWERVMTQFYKGKIEIIESYEDKLIRSVTFSIKMPAVVRELTRYQRRTAIKFSRENVYTRDKGQCQYCNKNVSRQEATYDHVIPKYYGGKTKWDNIVIACHPCNQKKGSKTVEQAGMKLKIKPIRPKSLPQNFKFTLTWKKDMPIEWRDCLVSLGYWHGSLEEDE